MGNKIADWFKRHHLPLVHPNGDPITWQFENVLDCVLAVLIIHHQEHFNLWFWMIFVSLCLLSIGVRTIFMFIIGEPDYNDPEDMKHRRERYLRRHR